MSVYSLSGVVRPYAWGSHTYLAELQGRPSPTADPEAEQWLGAHPDDPAVVRTKEGPVALDTLIARDPEGQLGAEVAATFGPRLPYLMKVLAAGSPLSLQAHPDAEYARAAYARQEADPSLPKNFTDPHHKPEILVALTDFSALCGFRDPAVSAEALAAFGLPALDPVIASLRAGDLRAAVERLLTWPTADRSLLTDQVLAVASAPAARESVGSATAALAAATADPAFALAGAGAMVAATEAAARSESFALAADLAARYPGDPGVLVALLLNHVQLAPGEAIWMPAGNLHAYLHGLGVELMAASDNVLRGGLTPKRVDVAELMNVLRFEVLDDPILPATEVADGIVTWQVPIPDFVLHRMEIDGTRGPSEIPAGGPRILLTTAGEAFAGQSIDGTPVDLPAGTAAYAPASAGPIKVAGTAQLFVATVPS